VEKLVEGLGDIDKMDSDHFYGLFKEKSLRYFLRLMYKAFV
jgi:hypothetical protein